MTSALRHD